MLILGYVRSGLKSAPQGLEIGVKELWKYETKNATPDSTHDLQVCFYLLVVRRNNITFLPYN